MKKVIKNYLAKLQENEKKGFSLVELIIVMAIMAILVGVVASQVLPYMEKSRQSKDQQQLSSLATNVVSAVAQSGKDVGAFTNVSLASFDTNASTSLFSTVLAELADSTNCSSYGKTLADKFASKDAKSAKAKGADGILVSMDAKGVVTVHASGAQSEKMTVTTE